MSSKMIQTSILRYITSDREHLAPKNSNSILLRLPYKIRKRIYEFAGLLDGLVINLNYDYPSWYDGVVTACNSFNELIAPHAREHEGRDQDLKQERGEGFADDDKVSNCEGKVQASEFSQRLSQFLDGPQPYPGARLYRLRPRCCKFGRDECPCGLDHLLLPSQLLDVCRVVSDEVGYLFYSRNRFEITSTHPGRLSGLFTLKPRFVSWISSLSISLCFCTCTVDPKVPRSRGCFIHDANEDRLQGLGIPGQEKLLQQAVTRFKAREMSEWKLFCRKLALNITPHQLKLWVKVLAPDFEIEMAKDITLPMMQMPVLQECTIYFIDDKRYTDQLQDLARDTALILTGRSSDALSLPFRFLDLPHEIQLQILRETDLVIDKDIAWCPDPDSRCPRVFKASNLLWKRWVTDIAYDYQCCEKCSGLLGICFCLSQNGGFSTSCTCWRMPMPIFSVCRQMREDATAIFFSLNSFLILPPPAIVSKQEQPLEILRFLSRFAARGRKHFRSVTWMLPERDHMFWGPRALGEWNQVIDICAEELSIKRLVFTIDMSYQARRRRSNGPEYQASPSSSKLEMREWHAGLSMVRSMARHNGWKNVYVHLSWPWHDPFKINNSYTSSGEARKIRERQEAVLEQQVMGPDNVADGKYDRRHKWNGYNCTCEECGDEDW